MGSLVLLCSIFALVVGFCIGATRGLESEEVKRLNKMYWETLHERDMYYEELEAARTEITEVKLELRKVKNRNQKQERKTCVKTF